MAFHDLRNHLSGVVMGALLSTVFLLPTFVLLFLYDTAMGWLGLAGGLASLAVTVTLGPAAGASSPAGCLPPSARWPACCCS